MHCENCTMFCTGKKSVKWESLIRENRLNGKGFDAQLYYVLYREKIAELGKLR